MIKFFGMWRMRFLCAADEIVQVAPDIGPSTDAQPSLQCLLSRLPKWYCLARPGPSFLCYFYRATAPPTLNADPDQALPFKRSQVSRQCRPIHGHEFGESGNRNDFIACNGGQDGKLRCAKTDGSQRVVI